MSTIPSTTVYITPLPSADFGMVDYLRSLNSVDAKKVGSALEASRRELSEYVSFGVATPLGGRAIELGNLPQGLGDINRPSYLYMLTSEENTSYLPLPWHALPAVFDGWIIAVGDKRSPGFPPEEGSVRFCWCRFRLLHRHRYQPSSGFSI